MPTFEDLRLIDLIKKFESTVMQIEQTRSLAALKVAGKQLQDVYDFFLTAQSSYEKEQEMLKNIFSSFNYAAVIVNNAVKCGGLSAEDNELLGECLQIMLKCCSTVTASLQK